MRGLWLEDRKLRFRDDLPVPRPAQNEALVRVQQAGICNTDLEMIEGYYSFTGVLGHEFVGVVEEGPADLIGQRVTGEINIACQQCPACRRGHPTHCEERQVLGLIGHDGAFADYLTIPSSNLHRVPEKLGWDAATLAEPLAAALEIQEQVEIGEADRVLVIGSGKLGQLIIQTLALTGCHLRAASRSPRLLPLAGGRQLEVETVSAIAAGEFDIAIECSGSPEGFQHARRALRPRGTLVMKSTYAGRLEIDASSMVVDEIVLIGSRCGPMAPALELLAAGRVDPEPLIAGRLPLTRGLEAFEQARQPGAGKILLQIGEERR